MPPVYTSALLSQCATLKDCPAPPNPPSSLPSAAGECCQRPWHWQTLQTLPFFILLNLQWQLPLLVTASWGLSPSLIFMKTSPCFSLSLRMHLQLPELVLPIKVLGALTDLPSVLPHSPISGQSHLYQWFYLKFLLFSWAPNPQIWTAHWHLRHDWSGTHNVFGRVLWASLTIACIVLPTFLT